MIKKLYCFVTYLIIAGTICLCPVTIPSNSAVISAPKQNVITLNPGKKQINTIEINLLSKKKVAVDKKATKKVATSKKSITITKKNAANKKNSKPVTRSIGKNKIGINGIYKSYVTAGIPMSSNALHTVQEALDRGNIVANVTYFSGTDNQSTYFCGHNPGVFSFMAKYIKTNSIVTVTDSQGTAYHYKMIEMVKVNIYAKTIMNCVGKSANYLFNYGSGSESICIQYCIPHSGKLMAVWYGIPVN